jgi:hypothetical protein
MLLVPDNSQSGLHIQTLSCSEEDLKGGGKVGPAEDTDSSIEEQLAAAKANRTRAETARQKIVNEIMEAAKELYQKLVSEGEQTLEKAKRLEAESELKHLEAQRELERAQTVIAEADAYREKVILQTQQQAQEILDQVQTIKADAVAFREKLLMEVQQQTQEELDRAQAARVEADAYREKVLAQTQQQAREILRQARLTAEQEGAEIKQKCSIDAEKRLAQAELIKAAAQEQLEAQRLYAEAATLETESKEVLKRASTKLRHGDSYSSESLDQKVSSSFLQGAASITRLLKVGPGNSQTGNNQAKSAGIPEIPNQGHTPPLPYPGGPSTGNGQDPSSTISEESSSKRQPSKNELVVGLELDGCAKAYPVQIAAARKVINDTVAGEDVVVTFGPPSEAGMIFKRCVDGRSLTFVPLPEAANGLMLMKDQETGTIWEALTGRAISGVLCQKKLQRLISEYSFWFAWSELHPDTEIYAEH